MIDDIADHWSCDWCGAKAVVKRPSAPAGATWDEFRAGKFPTRMDAAWAPGWWGFSPGDLPWRLRSRQRDRFSVLASMCGECLALPLLVFESWTGGYVIHFWSYERGSYVRQHELAEAR